MHCFIEKARVFFYQYLPLCEKAEPQDKSADQRSANHYYLKLKGILSVNGQSSVRSCVLSLVRSRVGEVVIEEECFKQLYSIKENKATNLVCILHRFNLVVRLIANKCYQDLFYFLSFLPTTLRLLSLLPLLFPILAQSLYIVDHIFKDLRSI